MLTSGEIPLESDDKKGESTVVYEKWFFPNQQEYEDINSKVAKGLEKHTPTVGQMMSNGIFTEDDVKEKVSGVGKFDPTAFVKNSLPYMTDAQADLLY